MPVLSSSWSSRAALLSCILVVIASNTFGTVRVAFAQRDNKKDGGNSNSDLSCMEKVATSCRECLATTNIDIDSSSSSSNGGDSAACGWVRGYGCLDSCSVIADVSCYSVASTVTSGTSGAGSASVSTSNFDASAVTANANANVDRAEAVCAIADADLADQTLCAGKLDCASCVATALGGGAGAAGNETPDSYCRWFGSELGFDTDGWCGNECTMIGCGKTTCGGDNENYDSGSNNGTGGEPVVLVMDAGAIGVGVGDATELLQEAGNGGGNSDGVTESQEPVDLNVDGATTTTTTTTAEDGKEAPLPSAETEDTPFDDGQEEGGNTTTTDTDTTSTSPTTNNIRSDENLVSPASNTNSVSGGMLLLLVPLLGYSAFWAF